MPEKFKRKQFPAGYSPTDFEYKGRPARDQNDFGAEVGICDMACVNQFGEANNAKFYHGGVVRSSDGTWWLYTEWGRCKPGPSWAGSSWTRNSQDFQFVRCSSEDEARKEFAKKMASKNIKRLVRITVAGKSIWAGKKRKDGYIVQRLATREKGLPDATKIKDHTGVENGNGKSKKAAPKKAKAKVAKPTRKFDPEIVSLAQALVGGTQTYTRAMAAASGVSPTMDAIEEVRQDLIPAALQRIKTVGDDISRQVRDKDLVAISKMVAALVPRPIPRKGQSEEEAILSAGNILRLQQDLDAFEASLLNEDFEVEAPATAINPDSLLNARLTHLNLRSGLGQWVSRTFTEMTRNRHYNVRNMRVRNIFAVERPDRDARFLAAVKRLAARKGQHLGDVKPGLQPSTRPDLDDLNGLAKAANVFVGIHGTRGVNVHPIMSSHFRMPQALSGVHITGAAFGGGIYFATDRGKSAQYVGASASVYGSGGNLNGRGFFMFLCDVAGGKFHYPRRAWGIGNKCPGGCDSVYAHPSYCLTLQNDEHVIFHPDHSRIRYLIELDV